MLGLVQHAKAYELLAIEAATSGDRHRAPGVAHELVGDYRTAGPLLDALPGANRSFLPRFFPEG